MAKRYRGSNPTESTAIKRADKAAGMPKDQALRLAAEAKARGDENGYDRFMAAARRAEGSR